MTNLNINIQSKKLLVTKIITIINKKLYFITNLIFKISYHSFNY